MKNKIVAIIAASAAALGSTIFSAPAHAQITTPPSNVGVSVSVPEVLYLRTVSTIDVDILPAELTAATLTASGSGFYGGDQAGTADGTLGVSTASPFYASVTKIVPSVFAVWSNSPRAGGVVVSTAIPTPTITGPNTSTITINSATPQVNNSAALGLTTPFTSGLILGLTLNGTAQAGDYTGGIVSVTASAP